MARAKRTRKTRKSNSRIRTVLPKALRTSRGRRGLARRALRAGGGAVGTGAALVAGTALTTATMYFTNRALKKRWK